MKKVRVLLVISLIANAVLLFLLWDSVKVNNFNKEQIQAIENKEKEFEDKIQKDREFLEKSTKNVASIEYNPETNEFALIPKGQLKEALHKVVSEPVSIEDLKAYNSLINRLSKMSADLGVDKKRSQLRLVDTENMDLTVALFYEGRCIHDVASMIDVK